MTATAKCGLCGQTSYVTGMKTPESILPRLILAQRHRDRYLVMARLGKRLIVTAAAAFAGTIAAASFGAHAATILAPILAGLSLVAGLILLILPNTPSKVSSYSRNPHSRLLMAEADVDELQAAYSKSMESAA